MEFVILGRTNLLVSRTAFGAMSLDCKEIEAFGEEADEKACAIVRQAYESGMNFFDTSRSSPVCEKRLGAALHGIRHNVMLATKTAQSSPQEIRQDLHESLLALESDYVDLYQLENPKVLPQKDGRDGIYNCLLKLQSQKLIRHFGIATDDVDIAREAVLSGLYETVQFPFNVLTDDAAIQLVTLCKEHDVGCIAMQPLCGGVLSNIPLAFGFLHQFEHVVPVWGVHTQEELGQVLYFEAHPPVVDEQFTTEVERVRQFFN